MPLSAPKRCRYCGELARGKCPTCERGWAQKPASWSGDRTGWSAFRAAWLAEHPWCIDCGGPAVVVCHYRGTDYSRDRLNPDAIEGQRCRGCDAVDTARQGNAAAHAERRGL